MIKDKIVEFEPAFVKSSDDYPFLKKFEENIDLFKKAYDFVESENFLHEMTEVSDQNNVQLNSWHLFPLYANKLYDIYLDFVSERLSIDVRALLGYLREKLPDTYQFLDDVVDTDGIVNVTFSRLKSNTTIKLHTNNDPFQYRAHIGIKLPTANNKCFLKVKDSMLTWRYDKFFIFDPTEPHMAWNLSDEDRVVMHVDFFRENNEKNTQMHYDSIKRKMESTPLGFEGGYQEESPEIIHRFNHIVDVVNY